MTDGVVEIRPPEEGDAELLIAGRDEAWQRWLGPGSADPRPTACIVVAGEVVGWVDFDTARRWLRSGEVNVGYNVFAPHRGKGYAHRGLELLLRHLDQATPFHTATLLIHPDNASSLAVAARSGFVPNGEIEGSRYFKRTVKSVRVEGLLLPIATPRLSLVVLTPELLALMSERVDSARPFSWPDWWPDEGDREHLSLWWQRAKENESNVAWGPRAIIGARDRMVGHAGFHAPPQPIENALSDPTFVGKRDPARSGAVELGYTVFPADRHRGYATEAVAGLLDWAGTTGEVGVVLASVERHNDASIRVLERVGGFAEVGTCTATDGSVEVVYRRDLSLRSAYARARGVR